MNAAIVGVLGTIVSRYGREIGDDPPRLEGLLRDLASEHRREISVLVTAARAGIPTDLAARSANAGGVFVAALASRLEEHYALTNEAAVWAVRSWGQALGIPVSAAGPGAIADASAPPAPASAGGPSGDAAFCSQCGAPLPARARFCVRCGVAAGAAESVAGMRQPPATAGAQPPIAKPSASYPPGLEAEFETLRTAARAEVTDEAEAIAKRLFSNLYSNASSWEMLTAEDRELLSAYADIEMVAEYFRLSRWARYRDGELITGDLAAYCMGGLGQLLGFCDVMSPAKVQRVLGSPMLEAKLEDRLLDSLMTKLVLVRRGYQIADQERQLLIGRLGASRFERLEKYGRSLASMVDFKKK